MQSDESLHCLSWHGRDILTIYSSGRLEAGVDETGRRMRLPEAVAEAIAIREKVKIEDLDNPDDLETCLLRAIAGILPGTQH